MSSKNKSKYKSYQHKFKNTHKLEAGLSGFLCTCNGKYRQRDCIRESYNILNEYAEELFGKTQVLDNENELKSVQSTNSTASNNDIDACLEKELESIKARMEKKVELRQFQAIDSGANGVVFIRTTISDPVKLAYTIVKQYSSGVQKSKFLLRLLPVEITCKAYMEDICNALMPLLEKYFSAGERTFAVVFNHRHNDTIKRDEIIEKLASLVYKQNKFHKADLKNPQLVILIEIIRSICCLSVVPEYFMLKKYNLLANASIANGNAKANEHGEKVEDKTSP